MRLVDQIKIETGAEYEQIMLMRHYNKVDELIELGGTIEEWTSLQATNGRCDFWVDSKPKIKYVAVIVHHHVYKVYKILDIQAESTFEHLASDEHKKFDIMQEQWKPDMAGRRYSLEEAPSSTEGKAVNGWQGREITPAVRSHTDLFWNIEIDMPATCTLPDEIDTEEAKKYYEGAVASVLVNRCERNQAARSKCIELCGVKCTVCDFEFSKVYGEEFTGFIHVHHLKPLSEIRENYEINPNDLKPVCPNCHAALHYGGILRSIEQLKSALAKQKNSNSTT